MELEKQIETLMDVGIQFRERSFIQQTLDVYEWWEYFNSPFELLLERICFQATCSNSRICNNVVAWDLKHLRHEGWFEIVATDMAMLSDQTDSFRIDRIESELDADSWRMDFSIGISNRERRFEITTRYPHKYAISNHVFSIAECFETASGCFVCVCEEYDPVVCWLPKDSFRKFDSVFPGRFRAITKNAG